MTTAKSGYSQVGRQPPAFCTLNTHWDANKPTFATIVLPSSCVGSTPRLLETSTQAKGGTPREDSVERQTLQE